MQLSCTICLDSMRLQSGNGDKSDVIVATTCGHVFHNACILTWFQQARNCPQCRMYIRRGSMIKLFLNSCSDNPSDSNTEEVLVALNKQLNGKKLECLGKDNEIIGLQIDLSVHKKLIYEKDKMIGDLQTCFANSELQIVEKDMKIQELQTSFANTELECLDKDKKIEELQTCFADSELQILAKDAEIEELQTCFARSELESLEKDVKIKDLQTFCAHLQLETSEKDEKIDELQTCFSRSELENSKKDEKIEELQTCFSQSEQENSKKDQRIEELQICCARLKLEISEKDRKIEELQASFSHSEVESSKKDKKIEELQTCCANLERDSEEMLDQQMKFNKEISAMKQEARKLSQVEDQNQKLLQAKYTLQNEKNDLISQLEHLKTVKTIVEGCPIDIKKIWEDVKVHACSDERVAMLKEKLFLSKVENTHLNNQLTKIKLKEENTQVPNELKLVKRRLRNSQSNSGKKMRQLGDSLRLLRGKVRKFKDLNSSISLPCDPIPVPVEPNLTNNRCSQFDNVGNCSLVCSPTQEGSSVCKNPVSMDFPENKRQKISLLGFLKKYPVVLTESLETPVSRPINNALMTRQKIWCKNKGSQLQLVLKKDKESSNFQKASYVVYFN